MNKIRLIKNIFVSLAALLSVSCTSELDDQATRTALREGEVSIQWLAPNMGIKHVKSRASDPKTAAEQQINNVHVFIFDNEGNYLNDGQNAVQSYRYVTGANLVLETTMFEDQTNAGNVTIVAVANVPENAFGTITNGRPQNITNLTNLETFVYNLSGFTVNIPEGGLPMVGRLDNQDLSSDAANKVILIQMKSLMARIDLNFTMDPYQSSDDRRNPSLLFNKVSVGNFPMGGYITPQLDTKDVTDNTEITLQEKEVSVTDFTGHTIREGEPQELTLYMFEHARTAKNITYPDGIDDDEKQRYKNERAQDDAAYITLEGTYTNHNGYAYAVTYKLYPGANAVDDFTIKSNCQYKNNITVKGITVNNLGDEALLDTRVNIDSEENPYFIEMLREREHDAHFNVTPMDVYIYKGGSVKVEIVEPESHTWIRMEPIKEAATEAGYGKRDYFTEDLLFELNQQENSTAYTVTGKEERIYFYIDENVPTEGTNGQPVLAREATLRITYTNDGQSKERDILIRQAGMLPVEYSGNEGYTFYVEYYEEYLEHYDGKDLYKHAYDGLEWGLEGIVTGLGKDDFDEFLPYGWRNTMTMMQAFQNTEEGKAKPNITLNDKPRSAAEYCYNKNKRDAQGKVSECHWYLPTIREMENIIDTYYGTFAVFQNNWYWSSNPGSGEYNRPTRQQGLNWGNITNVGEDINYARATKSQLDDNGTSFTHATSEANKPYAKEEGSWDTWYDPNDWWGNNINHTGANYPPYMFDEYNNANLPEGQGGFARRNKIFRIRAAYIYSVPMNAPSINNTYQ